MSQLDLHAYLERIGYTGPCTATLETLRALHLSHAQSIAFESLNPLSGRPVLLDLPSIERKLVREGRGGYCFEHNLLFRHVLQTLGFEVTGLSARVLWNEPEDAPLRPRGHMLLRVDIGGESHIADVGFGGLTLTAPLRLTADIIQETPHEPFRLVKQDGEFVLQSLLRENWKTLYQFDLQAQLPVDYEMANWYLATHPQSRFVNNLVAARPVPGKRFALFNTQLTIHHLGGDTEQRALGSTAELRSVLETVFGLTLPADPALDAALARLIR